MAPQGIKIASPMLIVRRGDERNKGNTNNMNKTSMDMIGMEFWRGVKCRLNVEDWRGIYWIPCQIKQCKILAGNRKIGGESALIGGGFKRLAGKIGGEC